MLKLVMVFSFVITLENISTIIFFSLFYKDHFLQMTIVLFFSYSLERKIYLILVELYLNLNDEQ